MVDDRHRELAAVLSYLVGRQLRTAELVDALGLSRSAYYLQRDEGRLVSADNLLRMAAAFDLNPVDLLVRYGLVSGDNVLDYAEELRAGSPAGSPARSTASSSGAAPAREARVRHLNPRRDAPPL